MGLLQKLFPKKDVAMVVEEELPGLNIESFQQLGPRYDKRIIALMEQINVPITQPEKNFFPENTKKTTYYQSIVAQFESIRDSLPKDEVLIIHEDSTPIEKFEAKYSHNAMILTQNTPVSQQIENLLHPNWYVYNIALIREKKEHLESSLDWSKNGIPYFHVQAPYVTSPATHMETIQVRPKGNKEKMLQAYALLRIQNLRKMGMVPHYEESFDEFDSELYHQMNQFTQSVDIPRDLSSYSLEISPELKAELNTNYEGIYFRKDDAYYEGKNIFILYDILDALPPFMNVKIEEY